MNILKYNNNVIFLNNSAIQNPGCSFIVVTTNKKLATLTCGNQSYTLTGDELSHAFEVVAGTYTCTATLGENTGSSTVVVTTNNIYNTSISLTRLPGDYIEVEYIESSGTQSILTDITFDDTVTFECEISRNNPTSASALCGYRFINAAGVSGNMRWFFLYGSGEVGCRLGVSSVNVGSVSLNTKTNIKYDGSNIYIDDTNVGYAGAKYTTSTYGKCGILYPDVTGYYGSDINYLVAKLYSFILKANNTNVFEGVPCRNTTTGRVGLYDLVSNAFYDSEVSDNFIAGPDVN